MAVRVEPDVLFFPTKVLRKGQHVVNRVTVHNLGIDVVHYTVVISHPNDLTSSPVYGSVSAGGTSQVEIAWTPSKPYNYSSSLWSPATPQLTPPSPPVVTLEFSSPTAITKSSKQIQVRFTRPGPHDLYSFTVNGAAYKSSSSHSGGTMVSSFSTDGLDSTVGHQSEVSCLTDTIRTTSFRAHCTESEKERAAFSLTRSPSLSLLSRSLSNTSATEEDLAAYHRASQIEKIKRIRDEVLELQDQAESMPKGKEPLCAVL